MAGNLIRRNQNLYCHYHQDQGHITEDYKNLWDHLDQLVREGKLKQLLHHSNGQEGQINSEPQRDAFFKASFRHDKCHLCNSREDQLLSIQNNVCHSTVYQELKFRTKEG